MPKEKETLPTGHLRLIFAGLQLQLRVNLSMEKKRESLPTGPVCIILPELELRANLRTNRSIEKEKECLPTGPACQRGGDLGRTCPRSRRTLSQRPRNANVTAASPSLDWRTS